MTSPFVVVGESLVDIVVPSDGSPRHDAVGGSCLNVAVGLARLDVPTTLVTRSARTSTASLWSHTCARATSTWARARSSHGGTTSTATAHLDAEHAATYDFEIVWDLPALKLPEDVTGVHVGSLGTVLEPGRSSVVDLVRRAVEDDVFVSYDPNIRPFFLDYPAATWRDVVALGAGARLLKLSDEDLRLLRHDSTRRPSAESCWPASTPSWWC